MDVKFGISILHHICPLFYNAISIIFEKFFQIVCKRNLELSGDKSENLIVSIELNDDV